jgi:hypothetical protein
MVNTKIFAKATSQEVTEFRDISIKCEKLASGLNRFSGIIDKDDYITQIDTAIGLIDDIFVLKAALEADKITLQNA